MPTFALARPVRITSGGVPAVNLSFTLLHASATDSGDLSIDGVIFRFKRGTHP